MVDTYKNIEKYNLNEKRKTLIVFVDVIADIIVNEKLNPIVTEFIIRGRSLTFLLLLLHILAFCCAKRY